MNRWQRAWADLRGRLKAVAMVWTNYTYPGWRTDWTKPWQKAVSDVSADTSGIVMACVGWIARTFPEAATAVYDQNGELVPAHPMTALISRPNPYYSGLLLWMATLTDFTVNGNAYWLKVRSEAGRVVELWYTPSWLINPAWPEDGSAFISHYDYRPAGNSIRVEVEDVVHFRYGLDAQSRAGRSPLAAVLSEIMTDTEAASFTKTLLGNLGVPGVLISPGTGDVDLSPDDAALLKADFSAKFSGDHRGEPMVIPTPTKIEVLSFSPEQMNLRELRKIPEERISAVLGVPAIVAGLGAGLDRSTFANMAEAREMAYESGIIPTQRLLAAELQVQLLPDFGDPNRQSVAFDNSQVRVLQDDEDKKYARLNLAVQGGWLSVAEARKATAWPVDPEHEVYYRPSSVTAVPVGQLNVPVTGAAPMLPAKGLVPLYKAAGDALRVTDAEEVERIYRARLAELGVTNGRG